MINSIGDHVGEEEFLELEHKERVRKGTKKILKGKDLHVGLRWFWPICMTLQEQA